jgi:hypothetical protein
MISAGCEARALADDLVEMGSCCHTQRTHRLAALRQHLLTAPFTTTTTTTTSSTCTITCASSSASPRRVLEEPLLKPEVVQQFDLEKFERDGFWVWESVLNERCIQQLSRACERVQQLNDQWIGFDWESLDWESLRAASTPLAEPASAGGNTLDYMNPPGWTAADVAYGLGHTHAMPTRSSPFAKHGYRRPGWDHERVPVLQVRLTSTFLPCHSFSHTNLKSPCAEQGYPPEMFPAGMDDYIMKCMIHPEMLAIHRKMLGPVVRFDHNTLLNRKGGFTGTGWHGHPHHEDGLGLTTRVPALGQVRSLVYPTGFGAGRDGGLRVVPGGHLYREARLAPKSGAKAQARVRTPDVRASHSQRTAARCYRSCSSAELDAG